MAITDGPQALRYSLDCLRLLCGSISRQMKRFCHLWYTLWQDRLRSPAACMSTKGLLKMVNDTVVQPDTRIGDDKVYLYVETKTRLIYEVKFLEGLVLLRMACPEFYNVSQRLTDQEFAENFTEYLGNPDQVFEFLDQVNNPKTELL